MKLSMIAAISFSALFAFGVANASVVAGSTPTSAPPAHSATATNATDAPVSQQDRLNGCNTAAVRQGLTGDKQKTFVATCMSAKK